jgi:hypothetical protein
MNYRKDFAAIVAACGLDSKTTLFSSAEEENILGNVALSPQRRKKTLLGM